MKFTDTETWAIISALRVAADKYESNVRTVNEVRDEGPLALADSYASLARQFANQAAVARELANRFEEEPCTF